MAKVYFEKVTIYYWRYSHFFLLDHDDGRKSMIFSFFWVCLGIFIWVELKLPLLGCFLLYPAGMVLGVLGCCPVGFCMQCDASVMVFGFGWCFVWSFLLKEKRGLKS